MRLRRHMQRKLALAFIFVALALFALSGRILYIIANKGDAYSKIVLTQQNYESTTLPFRRGTITDRNQTVLAASEQVYNIILDSSVMEKQEDVNATIDALVKVFDYDRADLMTKLSVENNDSYIRYARQLSKEQKTEFENYKSEHNADKSSESIGKVKGVWFESEYKRVYPYNNLACTVLGFSGQDSSMGNWGIEQYYNDYLKGVNGRSYGYLSTDGTVERTTKYAEDGCTIISTLDFTIQKSVEDIVDQFKQNYDAEHVGVLVMNPDNAEILAMVTDASYNLNQPADLTGFFTQSEIDAMSSEEKSQFLNDLWRNFMISDAFEPGSTAKAFTAAAALEENLAQAEDEFICDGGQQLAKDTYVRCAHFHGELNFEEALAYSCNDAMMQLGSRLGKNLFCNYQDMFGLGKLTGIDLPGETSGLLHPLDTMSVVDLGTNTFGQNYTVTMVQIAAAYASILNGGNYYQPHLVKQILSPEGDVVKEIGTNVVRETVSESTAQVIRESLQMCVESDSDFATGKKARISGYTVGGKTGTAEKIPRGSGEYLLSFIGFAPAENPQVIVYVIVDNPKDANGETITSASIAVRLEQMVMKSIASYMNLTSIGMASPELPNDLFAPIAPEAVEGSPEEAPVVGEDGAENPQEVPSADGGEVTEDSDKVGDADASADGSDPEASAPSPTRPVYSDIENANGDEEVPAGGFLDENYRGDSPEDEEENDQ